MSKPRAEPESPMSEEPPKYTIAGDYDPDGDILHGADPLSEFLSVSEPRKSRSSRGDGIHSGGFQTLHCRTAG